MGRVATNNKPTVPMVVFRICFLFHYKLSLSLHKHIGISNDLQLTNDDSITIDYVFFKTCKPHK